MTGGSHIEVGKGEERCHQLITPESRMDHLYRFLDCTVINFFHEALEDENQAAIDTVRGLFTEGQDLYPGSGFKSTTHIQTAVRNEECIKCVFRVTRP